MFSVGLFFEASPIDVLSWSFFRGQFAASSVDVFSWSVGLFFEASSVGCF